MSNQPSVEKLPHHDQLEFCYTRAKYRQGKSLTSVKVYTVNDESSYLVLSGVPAIKIQTELERLCLRYGDVGLLQILPNYPQEEFAEAYVVKYNNIKSARFAKNKMDGKSFFGGVLHVCYAPELETIEETRQKLADRRKSIAALTRYNQSACEVNKTKQTDHKHVQSSATHRYMSQLKTDLSHNYHKHLQTDLSDQDVSSDNVAVNFSTTASDVELPTGTSTVSKSNVYNASNNSSEFKNNEGPRSDLSTLIDASSTQSSNIDNSRISISSHPKRQCPVTTSISKNPKKIKIFKNAKILSYRCNKEDR